MIRAVRLASLAKQMLLTVFLASQDFICFKIPIFASVTAPKVTISMVICASSASLLADSALILPLAQPVLLLTSSIANSA